MSLIGVSECFDGEVKLKRKEDEEDD